MARARNVKPGLFKNEILGDQDPLLSLLFIGLWTLADKAGRMEDRPLRIKAELFPYRDGMDVNGYLMQLERLGFIHRYEANGLALIEITNFAKHQHPHHTEKNSEYPAYSIGCTKSGAQPLNNGDAPSDSLNTDSLNTDSVNPPLPPRKRRGSATPSPADFELFWKAYPKRKNRGQAERAWAKIKPDAVLVATILAAVEVAKASDDWRKDGGTFVPHPATWLSAKGWLDETRPAAYLEDESAVLAAYNRVLVPRGWPEAVLELYSPDRAAAVREFLGFSTKPNWFEAYFAFVADELEARPGCGFDWVIRLDIYRRCREGNFAAKREAA